MRERIVTVIIALLLFIPIIWYGSWILEIVMWALSLIALFELHRMKGIKFLSLPSFIAMIGMTLVVLSDQTLAFLPETLTVYNGLNGIVLLLLFSTIINKKYQVEEAALSLLGIAYIGYGFSAFIQVRAVDPHLLMLILLVIWLTDTGAYLVGRKIGKTKLAPALSPNKTIEGSIGGTVLATIVAAIYLSFVTFRYTYFPMLAIMILLSIAGQVGDLIESAIKRHFDVKDSGNILPGHGGILDRFDSMLFVMSIAVLVGLA